MAEAEQQVAAQQPQSQPQPSQPQRPPAKGNAAPSASGANGPSGPPQVTCGGRKKLFKVRGAPVEVDPQFDIIKAIGIGAYGLVCSAFDANTNKYVAIKKIPKLFEDLVDGKRVLRELKIMRHLGRHTNILELLDIMVPREVTSQELATFSDVYAVTDLMDADLHQILKSKQKLTLDHHAYFTYQMARAMAYIHSAGVIHRDLKPGNLLLNGSCDLKICDFGLARGNIALHRAASLSVKREEDLEERLDPRAPQHELTDYVFTRWYRPPELALMLGYNHSADMWSVGCILAEIISRKPLFPGKDYLSQLSLISEIVDIPSTTQELKDMMPNGSQEALRWVKKLRDQVTQRESARGLTGMDTKLRLIRYFRLTQEELQTKRQMDLAIELVSKLLVFDPHHRLTAVDMLRHPYVAKHHDKQDEVPFASIHGEIEDPHAWDFDHNEPDETALRRLFWEEMTKAPNSFSARAIKRAAEEERKAKESGGVSATEKRGGVKISLDGSGGNGEASDAAPAVKAGDDAEKAE